MSTEVFYDGIEAAHAGFVARGELEPDPYLNGAGSDPRRCVSVVAPLLDSVAAYRRLVADLPEPLRAHYVYPAGDLHVTVFDFTDALAGYEEDSGRERLFLEVFASATEGLGAFALALRGTVFTRQAGIIRGLDRGLRIQGLRKAIRERAAERGLPNRERFQSESAHVTFLRYLSRPRDLAAFRAAAARAKTFDLGVESMRALELVEHDWYNRASTRRVISRVELR